VETRHLITFRRIAEVESFTEAARQLGYSQSTVSAHVQALEEAVGGPLFDRSGRRPRLTEIGCRLRDLSEEILSLEDRVRGLGCEGAAPSGELRIAAGESVTVARLGEVLTAYRRNFPSVSLSLRNSFCAVMIDWILRGEADLAVVIMPPLNHADLEVRTLSEEEMVFVAAPWTEPDALVRALETGRMEEGFIFTERGCSYRIAVEHFFRSRGLVPERTMELWSMEAIRRCVQSGLGFSLVPRMYVAEDLRRGTIRELEAPPLGEVFRIQLAWRRNRRLSAAAREFVRIARENARTWAGAAGEGTLPDAPAPASSA